MLAEHETCRLGEWDGTQFVGPRRVPCMLGQQVMLAEHRCRRGLRLARTLPPRARLDWRAPCRPARALFGAHPAARASPARALIGAHPAARASPARALRLARTLLPRAHSAALVGPERPAARRPGGRSLMLAEHETCGLGGWDGTQFAGPRRLPCMLGQQVMLPEHRCWRGPSQGTRIRRPRPTPPSEPAARASAATPRGSAAETPAAARRARRVPDRAERGHHPAEARDRRRRQE